MSSIRAFLLSRLLGGIALVLAAAGVSVYLFVTGSLERQFDSNLDDRVRGFASTLFQVGDEVELEFSDELMPEYIDTQLPSYFQLVFDDGRVLERSDTLNGGELSVPYSLTFEPVFWSAELPDGRPGRFVARLCEVHHVYPEEGPDRPQAAVLRMIVARGREELVAGERAVLRACVLVSLGLLALIALVTWLAVRWGLEPAHRLADKLDAIRVDHLPERLDVGALPLELRPVADKTDALLRRLDEALSRERRTTADIAHELRTPISEVLTVAEVALRDHSDHEGARKALGTLRDVAWRMGGSVSTLLKLARLEMGAEQFESERVDAAALVHELLRSLGAAARERALSIDMRIAAGESVVGDREVLRIVQANLLGNALHYAPRGGTVTLACERDAERWSLVVENDAPALRPEDLGVLSQPFWRKDRARSEREHSGLGLALSRGLADKTGLVLGFELEHGCFRARLSGTDVQSTPSTNGVHGRRA